MKKEYSVKEVASLLGVSKPTVQKVINDLKKEPVRIDRGQIRVYSLDDMMDVIRVVRPGLDVSEFDNDRQEVQNLPPNAEKEVQNTANRCKDESQTGANDHQNLQNDRQEMQNAANALEMVLEALREELEAKNRQIAEKDKQLSEKDKQISEKDKQIENLQAISQGQMEAIKGLTENLKAAQALAAGDKKLLFESRTATEEKETVAGEFVVASDPVTDDLKEQEGAAVVTDQEETALEEPEAEKKGFWARLWHSLTN